MPLGFVIEDNPENARLFALVLSQGEFEVETLYDGETALARLSEVTPDLVILDLNLPGISGIDLLRHMRNDARLTAVPVIVATANPQMTEEITDLADLVLFKPVSYVQLRDLVARFS
ncbi:MAG: response regulator [Anaerolineae bacterium]|nr:response regulator [Anaerolineae bacterium]